MKENKLIAEFMEFPKQSDAVDDRTTAYYIGNIIKPNNGVDMFAIINNQNEDDVFHPDDMIFHSSWDWLMPVVEKCFQMQNENINYTQENDFFPYGLFFKLNDALLTTNIDEVFKAVINIIKEIK